MLSILLVENDNNHALLENALKNAGHEILKTQYGPSFLALVMESKPDAIIFNLDTPSERLIADLYKLNQQFPLPIIMFANDGSNDIINATVNVGVDAYIVDGLSGERLDSIILVAMSRFKHGQALKIALEDARTQLEDRKQIDRAKAILIKTQDFTEDEAYHKLRKLAMGRNITLGEMARNVIAMSELLK